MNEITIDNFLKKLHSQVLIVQKTVELCFFVSSRLLPGGAPYNEPYGEAPLERGPSQAGGMKG